MRSAQLFRTGAMALLGLGMMALAVVFGLQSWPQPNVPAAAPATPPDSPVSVIDGVTVIRLDEATQLRSGIETAVLRAASHRASLDVRATVLDLQPLIDLSARHDVARAELARARVALALSLAEFERDRKLFNDERNVSLKAYQAAQAAYKLDAAKADAADLALRNVEAAARERFGPRLASWAFDAQSARWRKLMGREEVLAQMSLPPGYEGAPSPEIGLRAVAGNPLAGYLVGAAARQDPALPGRSFVYRVATDLASGTRLMASIPLTADAEPGVFVPQGAVLWFAGQPWLYERVASNRFARRSLVDSIELDDGLFVRRGVAAGARIVTRGAQLLLSDEQRPPPAGAGCKDPECD